MAGDTVITVIGNLTSDADLSFTQSGDARAAFTIASTPRSFDRQSNTWKDGETLFMRCTAWREMAENIAESCPKGTRVIATGRLVQRSYKTREGEDRTSLELQIEEIGASLRWAKASLQRVSRSNGQNQGGNYGGNQGYNQGPNQGYGAAPTGATPAPAAPANQGGPWGANDAWASGGYNDAGPSDSAFDQAPPF